MRTFFAALATALSLTGAATAACLAPTPAPVMGGPPAMTALGGMKPVPPPARHTPVPDGPLAGVHIRLTRDACYGECPIYRLDLWGDGRARFEGAGNTLVDGVHEDRVDPKVVACLVDAFRAADFWSLPDSYSADITDESTTTVALDIGGHSKTLTDYAGRLVGLPPAVTDLEHAIGSVARKWLTGDAMTLAALQAEGFDVRSPAGGVLLVRATRFDNPELALSLLAAGAPADTPDGRGGLGTAPVELAADHGRAALVRALIDAGALRTGRAGLKDAVLLDAAGSGDPDTVDEILKEHPDPNARESDGGTPLMALSGHASLGEGPDAEARRVRIAAALISAGADPRLRDASDTTPLFFQWGAARVQLLLDAGAELEHRNATGDTPVLLAETDDGAMGLIEAGADISAVNDDGEDLHAKATKGTGGAPWTRTLAYLSAHGRAEAPSPLAKLTWPADDAGALEAQGVDLHSRRAAVALIRAANEGREALALDLVRAGAPVNQVSMTYRGDKGASALAAAAATGQVALLRALLAAGALRDAPWGAQDDAFAAAVKAAQPGAAAILLQTRPDLYAATDDRTPLTLVGDTIPGHAGEARWRVDSLAVMRLLLAAGADPRRADADGATALHHANSAAMVQLLVTAGARVDARDAAGATPLMVAEDDDVAMALVAAGADIHAHNEAGDSVFKTADDNGNDHTLAYLRRHGVNR